MFGKRTTQRATLVLLAIQSVLLIFLSARLVVVDSRSTQSAIAINALNARMLSAGAPAAPDAAAPPPAIDEAALADVIRAVVRTEFAAAAAKPAEAQAERPEIAAATPPPLAGAAAEEANALLRQEMSLYIAQGSIDPTEMAALQQRIARLPPAQRREALADLTAAINSGRVKAQF